MSEIPEHSCPRRLVDWINPTEAKKVHSLIDSELGRIDSFACFSEDPIFVKAGCWKTACPV